MKKANYNPPIDDLSKVVENLTKQISFSGEQKPMSETAEAIETINRDEKESDGFTRIDFLTDLSPNQVIAITKLDTLARLGVMTEDDVELLTRTFQRKRVSLKRKGRGEAVDMHKTLESKKDGGGFFQKFFTPKQ